MLYFQSAYELETEEKREQELNSLKRIDDSFQKIVIVKDEIMPYRDNNGILFTGLFQFLSSDELAKRSLVFYCRITVLLDRLQARLLRVCQ